MLTPMYMVVSMHLLWAGANGANLVVDEAVAPWLRLPLPTTTARLPRRATTAKPRSILELMSLCSSMHHSQGQLLHGFMRSAQHKNGDEQIEVDGQRGLRIESRVLVNTTKDMSGKRMKWVRPP